MRLLLTISLLAWLAVAQAGNVQMIVQQSPLAGSQYYAIEEFRQAIRIGDRLALVREADNRHDRHAIRVDWQGHPLGYVPRSQNRALAAAMDGGERLAARVSSLSDNKNPWQRLAFEVFVEL